jgi:hypothetical protein
MPTRLDEPDIEEVSGVENPANELPGFIMIKSQDEAEALLKDVDTMEQDFAILYAALETIKSSMTDAPAEAVSAVDTLMTYIEGLFDESGGGQAPADGIDPAQPVAMSADQDGKPLLAKLLHRQHKPVVKTEDEPAPEKPVEKSDDGDELIAKSRERREARIAKEAEERSMVLGALQSIVGAVEDLTSKVDEISKNQTETADTTETLKSAVAATLDRIGRVEAQPAGPLGDPAPPVVKSQDGVTPARQSLRAGLVQLAQNPGSSLTLGRGE